MENEQVEIRFNDFVRLKRGYDLPDSKIIFGSYPIVASSSVKGFHNIFKVSPPAVVTGRSGTLGVVQFVDKKCWPLNTSLYVKDFKGNHPKYVYYFLQTMHLENFNSGAGVPTLNQNHLHNQKLKIHKNIELQRKVADVINNYDQLIENNTKRIAILEQMAEQIYKEWFVRMRFPGYENTKFVKGIPEGWKVERVSDICKIMSGGTPSTKVSEFWDGSIPFFTPKDVPDSFYCLSTLQNITESGLRKCNSKLYPKNTIMLTARGTVGKISLLNRPMAMNQSCFALTSSEFSNFYLFMLLKTQMEAFKKMANGATFDSIVLRTFDMLKVLHPSKELINQYSELSTPFFNEISILLEVNDDLIKTRNLLLPRLISGKLSVEHLTSKLQETA